MFFGIQVNVLKEDGSNTNIYFKTRCGEVPQHLNVQSSKSIYRHSDKGEEKSSEVIVNTKVTTRTV